MRTLILHAKAPLPGFAKSRLVAAEGGLDVDRVAGLCDAFLRDTLAQCLRAGADELVLHYTPESAAPYFRELAPGATLDLQVDGPFGDRLRGAFARTFARGPRDAVLVGMDTPHLEARTIDAAFAALATHDAVLGPASDGGYYLLGTRRRCDHLFEAIDWSTERVANQTRQRANESGLSLAEVEELFDVDVPADLDRLRAMTALDPSRCPHTAKWFATMRDRIGPGGSEAGGDAR